MTTGAAAGAEETDGADVVVAVPVLTLEAPGVGTTVVITRRLITFRTSTFGGAAADWAALKR